MQPRSEGDNSPANHHQPGIDWSDAPEFGRRQTLLKTLQRLYTLHPGPACIVETETLRDDLARARDGDGWSTLAWGWYAAQTDGAAFPPSMKFSDFVPGMWFEGRSWPHCNAYRTTIDYIDE